MFNRPTLASGSSLSCQARPANELHRLPWLLHLSVGVGTDSTRVRCPWRPRLCLTPAWRVRTWLDRAVAVAGSPSSPTVVAVVGPRWQRFDTRSVSATATAVPDPGMASSDVAGSCGGGRPFAQFAYGRCRSRSALAQIRHAFGVRDSHGCA